MKTNTKIFWAFIGGTITGAALGILFAPDTGKNTREKLGLQLQKYFNQLQDLLNRNDSTTTNNSKSSSLSNEDRQKAEQLLKEVESMIENINQRT
ncbi:MAG: YtxH domain-containing protein [Bacteroidia bacterium]|nr:YtxH domain-containing protein [Bacteroidia bacterium]